jgi:O-antigen/teichoic acid export membrane protein
VQVLLLGMGAACFAVVLPFGRDILRITFGAGFGEAYPILVAHLTAVFLLLHSSPARSAILAMNRPGYALLVAFASSVTFLITAMLAIPALGALGASVAHIAFGIVTAAMLDAGLWRGMKARSEGPSHRPPVPLPPRAAHAARANDEVPL